MIEPLRRLLPVLAAAVFFAPLPAGADALKDAAIARLAASHDPTVAIAVGSLVVKQAGLDEIRSLLAQRGREAALGKGWNRAAPEWQSAEARLLAIVEERIDTGIRDPAWFYQAWSTLAADLLNAEEADEIASHFATPGGKEQRVVVELLVVGDMVMTNYTFTGRIRQNVRGSEREMAQMQTVWWDREPFRVRDFSGDPGALRFAGQSLGNRYVKMLAIQGVEAVTGRIDAVVRETRAALQQRLGEVDPMIAAFRQANHGQ
jgi:hypothetical protein